MTLLGVLLVAKGIGETHELFGRPRLFARAALWIRRFPLFRSFKPISGASSGSVRFGGSANAMLGFAFDATAPVETRLHQLERSVTQLVGDIAAIRASAESSIANVKEELRAETEKLGRSQTDIARRLENYSAGGLDYEIVGAAWVVVGQALSSFPSEIGAALTEAIARGG